MIFFITTRNEYLEKRQAYHKSNFFLDMDLLIKKIALIEDDICSSYKRIENLRYIIKKSYLIPKSIDQKHHHPKKKCFQDQYQYQIKINKQ